MGKPKVAAARVTALFLLLVGGCAAISTGAHMLSPPAGYIVGGVLSIAVALGLAYLHGLAAK